MNEEEHDEVADLQAMVHGNTTLSVALCLTLIDAGVIDKNRFLDIVESLRSMLASNCKLMGWDAIPADIPVELFLATLTTAEWEKGKVLEKLHAMEKLEAIKAQPESGNDKFFPPLIRSKNPKKDGEKD